MSHAGTRSNSSPGALPVPAIDTEPKREFRGLRQLVPSVFGSSKPSRRSPPPVSPSHASSRGSHETRGPVPRGPNP
ncbi:hypothetical protein NW767_15809 [Fusarium falciforme]|nr:hypothetical protein NW767_15809 [Fusarium falciforme]